MNNSARGHLINLFLGCFVVVGLTGLVMSVSWGFSATTSRLVEDQLTLFEYNFTANVSNPDNDTLVFRLDTIVSNPNYTLSENPSNYPWININATSGIMSINSTHNNQTGRFNITVEIRNLQNTSYQGSLFYFIVNATNDAPNFTNIQSQYNLSQDENFLNYLNATDEEGHYPLVFNITFLNNCTHAAWTGRSEGENCTIFDAINFTNTSAIMNFTPGLNDVGTYWANVTVMDFGNSSDYGCPHEYCTPETYNLNQTTFYSSVVRFNIESVLNVNISDCQNKIFQENVSGNCQINITSTGQTDLLNISSSAALRSYTGGFLNASWFISNTSVNAENFSKSININFTPQKTEIGNWTINFTVQDLTSGSDKSQLIYVYVNKSVALDDVPDLESISDVSTSIDLPTTISLSVLDEDLRIPHKDSAYGGYNETISFDLAILNASDLSQHFNITGFDVDIISMPVLSSGVPTNQTTARIQFTPNQSESGNYTINLTVTDVNGGSDTENFNLFILSNVFPQWNESLQTIYSIVEGGSFYYNLSANVTDSDGDVLTFSNWSSTSFPAFSLNATTGEINITEANDADVGQHIINITVSDGYLTNTTVFNFTVNNTNEAPFMQSPLTVSGISRNGSSNNMNVSEDTISTITLSIWDNDFNILQKGYYNESLTINLTIEGVNTNLFNFTFDSFWPGKNNKTKYIATFTPAKADIGNYNISINVSDKGNLSDFISFNLTIEGTQHNPNITLKDNLVSSVEESILIDFNATDLENGNDSDGSLRFNITFLSGNDFINYNETIFNTTSGYLNFTFNSSLAGVYSLNVSVNDTTGRQDSFVWNVTVYDYPQIISPASSFFYSMFENVSYNLNFSVNHTVQDVLNYSIYINGVLRNTTSGNGNASDFLWSFTSNFTDETTCSGNVNLTLNVSNSKLSNSTSWSLQINHTNAPLTFRGTPGATDNYNIGGSYNLVTGGSTATINLSAASTWYFTDVDASDSCVNQTIGFTTTFLNGTSLSPSVTNWTNGTNPSILYTHPSSGTVTGNYSLFAQEYNSSNSSQVINTVYANNFTVELSVSTVVVTVPVTSSGGSGSTKTTNKPISLKLIVPEPISSRRKDRLVVPISVINTGKVALNGIFLRAGVAKDGLFREDMIASFDNSVIDSLAINEEKKLTLIVDANTEEYGLYEITINATVKDPVYSDWAKIFVNVEETEDILERILFTEEFVIGNPECVELTELVDEARSFLNAGAIDESYKKLGEALEACRLAIEQPAYIRVKNQFEKYLFNYIWLVSVAIFVIGFIYYSYRRRKLRSGLKEVNISVNNISNKEKFNNKKKFI